MDKNQYNENWLHWQLLKLEETNKCTYEDIHKTDLKKY